LTLISRSSPFTKLPFSHILSVSPREAGHGRLASKVNIALENYDGRRFVSDLIAGVTVGLVAVRRRSRWHLPAASTGPVVRVRQKAKFPA
jgi:hypothetical protein